MSAHHDRMRLRLEGTLVTDGSRGIGQAPAPAGEGAGITTGCSG